MKAFKKLQQSSPELQRLQQNVETALEPVLGCPLLDGVLLEAQALTTGQANIIEHKLARPPRGVLVVKQNADARIWQNSSQALPTKAIDVRCSANVTVSLWVF